MQSHSHTGSTYLLVGCGAISQKHLDQITTTGKLLAICDNTIEKAKKLATQYGAKAYDSFELMLKENREATIAVICTPNGLHAQQSIQALENGQHVLCEKPMALRSVDAAKMIEKALAKNKILTVVKQNRFNAPIVELKKWIDSGDSGKLFSFSMHCLWNRNQEYYKNSSWRGTLALDGGVLYTQFSHFIDFLYWLFGEVKDIQTMQNNTLHPYIEFADQGVINLRFDSGILGSIHFSINTYLQNMEASLTVLAQNGTIRIGGIACNEIGYQSIDPNLNFQSQNMPVLNQYGDYIGSVSSHEKVYTHFLDQINTGVLDLKSLTEAMKTIELIERINTAG